MDIDDFATSPAKRRRTISPEDATESANLNSNQSYGRAQMSTFSQSDPSTMQRRLSIPGLGLIEEAGPPQYATPQASNEEYGILDALMQHVESESKPETVEQGNGEVGQEIQSRASPRIEFSGNQGVATEPNSVESGQDDFKETWQAVDSIMADVTDQPSRVSHKIESEQPEDHGSVVPATEISHSRTSTTEDLRADQVVATDAPAGQSANSELESDIIHTALPAGEVPEETVQVAEWEMDSSPLNSSDSDSSDISSSEDSDDDADGEYAMLNPEEQARILMAGDGGSDDEGGKSRDKGDAAPIRTANEKVEEIIPKPAVVITEDMPIVELGKVEGVVEGTVLIKAKVSGEYQVLESGSLLCLKDRSVIGVVAEPLGRVEQPLYTIRFTNDNAIEEAGVSKADTVIYYVPTHSTFVFTQPLRAVKGSDASNFHDEEVGDDEMEFSDDEAEQEHKRMMKMNRRGKRDDGGGRGRGGRGGRGNNRGDRQFIPNGNHGGQNDTAYGNGSLEISYDDTDPPDDGYTTLARPSNFQEMINHGQSIEPQVQAFSHGGHEQNRGRGRGRGGFRGDRGNSRGGRGRGRGGWDRSSNGSDRRQSYANDFSSPSTMQQSPPVPFTPSQMPPQNQIAYQYQSQPPHPPTLNPQNPSYSNFPFSPSPISPLPNQQFNFGGYGQQQQHLGNSGHFQQQHPQVPLPNPAFMQNFNQVASAEVQRLLEQMRQNGGR